MSSGKDGSSASSSRPSVAAVSGGEIVDEDARRGKDPGQVWCSPSGRVPRSGASRSSRSCMRKPGGVTFRLSPRRLESHDLGAASPSWIAAPTGPAHPPASSTTEDRRAPSFCHRRLLPSVSSLRGLAARGPELLPRAEKLLVHLAAPCGVPLQPACGSIGACLGESGSSLAVGRARLKPPRGVRAESSGRWA